MGVEKEGTKSEGGHVGGFFQLFDWTSKSRKKLFATKSDLPGTCTVCIEREEVFMSLRKCSTCTKVYWSINFVFWFWYPFLICRDFETEKEN